MASLLSCAQSHSPSRATNDDTDSGSSVARGEVGSHVWFDTSQSIEVRESWFSEVFGTDASAPISGNLCGTLDRSAMNAAQLAALEEIVLVPLTDGCTVDGFRYLELTVVESDGQRSTYRDTGCNILRVEGATAMLAQGSISRAAFPQSSLMPCP